MLDLLRLNGSGTEFAAGDSVSIGGATATISTGGVGTAAEFVFRQLVFQDVYDDGAIFWW